MYLLPALHQLQLKCSGPVSYLRIVWHRIAFQMLCSFADAVPQLKLAAWLL